MTIFFFIKYPGLVSCKMLPIVYDLIMFCFLLPTIDSCILCYFMSVLMGKNDCVVDVIFYAMFSSCQLRFDVPQLYKFHKKKEVDIAVDLWRFVPKGNQGKEGKDI